MNPPAISPTTRLLQPSLSLPTPANGVQPEAFQTQLIQGMTQALLRTPSPRCLLRAPTGSGKTFVISQVLERLSSQREVVWFWFVPFVTLVAQTLDALLSNAPGLSPTLFASGRNQDVQGGAVLISTAQGVARAQWRTKSPRKNNLNILHLACERYAALQTTCVVSHTARSAPCLASRLQSDNCSIYYFSVPKGYDADGDDDVRTLAALVARARAKSLQVGLVVDEAHIGLDKSTEFGKFAHWLKADYLLMATATPKDERLNEFLIHAGYDAQESFAVSRDAVLQALAAHRLRVFPLKSPLPQLARCLKTEEKPELNDLSEISRAVASRLVISPLLQTTAVKAALNRIKQKERHTELTTGAVHVDEIQVVTDRAALAREAMAALRELPQAEEEDYKIIVQVISSNLRRAVDDEIDNLPEDLRPSEPERVRLARDAAHWVIRSAAQDLREDMFSEIAKQAKSVDAKPLPDVMVFPQDMALESSSKNIYGVLPPASEDAQRVEQVLFMDDRHWWADRTFVFDDGSEFTVGRFDGAVKLNSLERSFARALDDADFVLWWHRNPDKKAYAVRVVRGEHEHYFYPDFVVCLKHNPADKPMQRLLETKENTKDAARKAQHTPAGYGKVLFLTPDGSRLKWVNDDGSLGEVVNLADMAGVLARFAATRPVMACPGL